MKRKLLVAFIIVVIVLSYPLLKNGVTVSSSASEEELITTIGRTLRLGEISLIGKRVSVYVNEKESENTIKLSYSLSKGTEDVITGDVMEFDIKNKFSGEFTTLLEYDDFNEEEPLRLYVDVTEESGGQATVIELPNFLYKSDRFSYGSGTSKYNLDEEFVIYETSGRGENDSNPWSFKVYGLTE